MAGTIVVDITEKASQYLQDAFSRFSYSMLDNDVDGKGVSKIRGDARIFFGNDDKNHFIDSFHVELKFEFIADDGSKSIGKLVTSELKTRENLSLSIIWEKPPPAGFLHNQASAILTSSKCKAQILLKYDIFLDVCRRYVIGKTLGSLHESAGPATTDSTPAVNLADDGDDDSFSIDSEDSDESEI